jgi:ATP-binding cassette subfamily C (CFTR/MRP) protein 3
MCKPTAEEIDATEQVVDDTTKTNGDGIDNDTNAKPDDEVRENFSWWQGGGVKPRSGHDLGVFERSLEDGASCLSLWTLSFLNPLLSLGSRKVLDAKDVGVPSAQDRAERAYSGVKQVYDDQMIRCDAQNAPLKKAHQAALDQCTTDDERNLVKPLILHEPSVAGSLIGSFGRMKLIMAMLYYIVSALLSFIPVLILSDLVQYFEFVSSEKEGSYNGFAPPWVEVVAMGIIPLMVSTLQTRHQAVFAHCGVFVRTAVSTLLYRKALKVSAAGRAKTSTGQVVNMMSNDTMQLQRFLQFVGLTMVAPIQIVIALYFIYQQVRNTSTE